MSAFIAVENMLSPKKPLTKENSFIIRKTPRPPTPKSSRTRDSPDKRKRELNSKYIKETYNYSPSRSLGPSSLGKLLLIQG